MNNILISNEQIKSILEMPEVEGTNIQSIDVRKTIDYFTRFYVNPLSSHFDISKCQAVDCASGYGWFSVSYILAGGKAIIASEIDEGKVSVAKKIAEILKIDDKIDYRKTLIQNLPFDENEIDIFVSIETLEHVGSVNRKTITETINLIKKITSTGILITTPNKFFPAVAHDTRLPLIHYLPPKRRKWIAKLLGREKKDTGNEFVSPLDIGKLKDKFKPVSRCLTFNNFKEYLAFHPHYVPYGAGGKGYKMKNKPSSLQALYFRVICILFGTRSYYFMPSMKVILKKN